MPSLQDTFTSIYSPQFQCVEKVQVLSSWKGKKNRHTGLETNFFKYSPVGQVASENNLPHWDLNLVVRVWSCFYTIIYVQFMLATTHLTAIFYKKTLNKTDILRQDWSLTSKFSFWHCKTRSDISKFKCNLHHEKIQLQVFNMFTAQQHSLNMWWLCANA